MIRYKVFGRLFYCISVVAQWVAFRDIKRNMMYDWCMDLPKKGIAIFVHSTGVFFTCGSICGNRNSL